MVSEWMKPDVVEKVSTLLDRHLAPVNPDEMPFTTAWPPGPIRVAVVKTPDGKEFSYQGTRLGTAINAIERSMEAMSLELWNQTGRDGSPSIWAGYKAFYAILDAWRGRVETLAPGVVRLVTNFGDVTLTRDDGLIDTHIRLRWDLDGR